MEVDLLAAAAVVCTQTVAAGVQFFFPAGGVSQFSVRGIETSAGLDPGNVTAFITGLTWVGLGEFTGTMTPVIQFVPAAAVPFPASLVLLGVGLAALAWTTRRSWLSWPCSTAAFMRKGSTL